MRDQNTTETETDQTSAWGAVAAMALGVFGLVGSEFLPASLLTPMAADLNVNEGVVGQAVTATAIPALIASLFVAPLTRRFDRRSVIIAFSLLLIVSNVIVAMSASIWTVLVGRVFLGFALGGFWTLSLVTIARLVSAADSARAMSIVMSGISAATVFAAPAGSFFGDLIGWRGVFFAGAGLGIMALIGQAATLPPLPPRGRSRLATLIEVAKRPGIAPALIAVLLIFTGHFAFFTYIRPFLETVTTLDVGGISTVLLCFGIATFAGNYLGAFLFGRSMRVTLAAMPFGMGVLALLLVGFGHSAMITASLAALWGVALGTVPVAWSTWFPRAAPDEAETASGLFIAAINAAIAAGALIGGAIYESAGIFTDFIASGLFLMAGALVVTLRVPDLVDAAVPPSAGPTSPTLPK